MMREFELEEGEACGYLDDDKNIDPDKDFGYIDKKLQDVLGQYQKNFMGGVSAENLGSMHGGYGSFLPVQQRSPRFTAPRSQHHIPHNLPSEDTHQNPASRANESLALRLGSSSHECGEQASGTFSLTNVVKQPNTRENVPNDRHSKLPTQPDQRLPKVRLKMGSQRISAPDNSAIYSGLGLDMSPCTSPDDNPPEFNANSPGVQEMQEQSPSWIIEIMTSFPVPNGKVLSPLQDRLIGTVRKEENNLENRRLGCVLAIPVDLVRDRDDSRGTSKVIKDGKLNRKDKIRKSTGMIKGTLEGRAEAVASPLKTGEDRKTPVEKGILPKFSVNAVSLHPEGHNVASLTNEHSVSDPSFISNKKSEVCCKEETVSKQMKEVLVAEDSTKERVQEFASSNNVGMINIGKLDQLKEKVEKGGEASSILRKHAVRKQRNEEVRHVEGDSDKLLLKQPEIHNDKRKEAVLDQAHAQKVGAVRQSKVKETLPDPVPFQEADGFDKSKDTRFKEKIQENNDLRSVSKRYTERNKDEYDILTDMRHLYSDPVEPLKQMSEEKVASHPKMQGEISSGKDNSLSRSKKKSKEGQSDGRSSVELSNESLKIGSSAEKTEDIPSRNKRVDLELHKETRKAKDGRSGTTGDANLRKREKLHTSVEPAAGVSEREVHAFSSKLKEKSSGKKVESAPSRVPDTKGTAINDNLLKEKAPASDAPAEENAVLIEEDWVQCEKCQKWRLLPIGTNPDNLPKRWLCSMINWLPGMNKCSFSEEETTNALHALYQAPVLAPQMLNDQLGYSNGGTSVIASSASQYNSVLGQVNNLNAVPGGENKKSLVQGHKVPTKKDELIGVTKKLSQSPLEFKSARTNGEAKLPKTGKKREADREASEIGKKVKIKHQQFTGDMNLIGPSAIEARGNGMTSDLSASKNIKDFGKNSSKSFVKTKTKNIKPLDSDENEMKDALGKKRKSVDRERSPWIETPSKKQHSLENEVPVKESSGSDHRKAIAIREKSKESKFQDKDDSANQGHGKNSSNRGEYDMKNRDLRGHIFDKGGRKERITSEHQGSKLYLNTSEGRNCSERQIKSAEPAAASSSSKNSGSYKVKFRSREGKCSPVGSISSSPLRFSKSDDDKLMNKIDYSHDEQNEEMKDMKLKAADDGYAGGKISSRKVPSDDKRDDKLATKDQGSKSVDRLNSERMSSGKENSDLGAHTGKKREPQSSHSRSMPESGKGDVGIDMAVDDHDSRHPIHDWTKVAEASSSMKKGSSHWDARTALREAKDLKHSANRLKINGSGLESTEVFFQAALKFLHGASLLEPGNSGEMKSLAVYSTTAKLCEYCAQEYERCNDMACATLAYKCMEVAYMRVIYSNDLIASRDREELQMALRAVPQVDSPSSSASDVDNLNNPVATDMAKDPHFPMDQGNHVISAGNRPSFVRLLNFANDVNFAMEATRKSQAAFVAANTILTQAGNAEGVPLIKRVLDFSFHDVDGLLHLVRFAMEALNR